MGKTRQVERSAKGRAAPHELDAGHLRAVCAGSAQGRPGGAAARAAACEDTKQQATGRAGGGATRGGLLR